MTTPVRKVKLSSVNVDEVFDGANGIIIRVTGWTSKNTEVQVELTSCDWGVYKYLPRQLRAILEGRRERVDQLENWLNGGSS